FFSFSPDAQHPVGGVSHRQPVARSAGTQFAKMQSSFAKGFLRVAVPQPICKETFFPAKV
ncbi:MAG: hypothetical protein IKJ51_06225, partial [Clostridia bacterium]|nr:hypothetical protein [Clostridia bacterium]